MKTFTAIVISLFLLLIGCKQAADKQTYSNSTQEIHVIGAMKQVMWKGELEGIIKLDTLESDGSLYGLGPESFLTGELLISKGKTYVSRVTSDSTMTVEQRSDVTAPFFVYGYAEGMNASELPPEIKSIPDLERFLDQKSKNQDQPFLFTLSGTAITAKIHVQNLPPGSKVTNPDEAHQGQVDFLLNNRQVEIVGFYSTKHQGIFTHHHSHVHMHLITSDKSMMGHLDEIEMGEMVIYLPAL